MGEIPNDENLVDDLNLLQTGDSQSVFETHNDLEKYFGGSERFEVKLYDNLTYDSVVFNVNNVNYTRPVENSFASIAINLDPGVYEITTTCPAAGESVKNKITVDSTIEASDLTKYFGQADKFEAKILDSKGNPVGANQDVVFNINGVFYTRATDDKGVARLNINLNQGKYTITTTNPSTKENKSNSVEVISLIESKDLTKYYKNDSQFTVKIHDAKSGEVSFNINGVYYTRPINSNGEATLNINLAPYDYVITTEYNGCRQSNIISVKRTLKTNDLALFYKDGSEFLAEVLDGQGKKLKGAEVEFNINGVFYHKTTDDSGIARLTINLPTGLYVITSSYNGYSASNTVLVSELIDGIFSEIIGNFSASDIKHMVYEQLDNISVKVGTPTYIGDFKWSIPLYDSNGNELSPIIIDTMDESIQNIINQIPDSISNDIINKIIGTIPDSISDDVKNRIIEFISDEIKNRIAESIPDIQNIISGSTGNIADTITETIENAVTTVVMDIVKDAVADAMPSTIPEPLRSTMQTAIINGISDSLHNSIEEYVQNAIGNIPI